MILHEGPAAQSFMSLSANAVIAVEILLQIKSDTLLQPEEEFIYSSMKSKIAFASLRIAVYSTCMLTAALRGLLVIPRTFRRRNHDLCLRLAEWKVRKVFYSVLQVEQALMKFNSSTSSWIHSISPSENPYDYSPIRTCCKFSYTTNC